MQRLKFKILSRSEADTQLPILKSFYQQFGNGVLYPRSDATLLDAASRSNVILIETERGELAGVGCLFQHPFGQFDRELDFQRIDAAKNPQPQFLEFGADLIRPEYQGWKLHLDLINLRIMLAIQELPARGSYAICEVKPPPPHVSYQNYRKCAFSDHAAVSDVLRAAQYDRIDESEFPDRYKCVTMPLSTSDLKQCGARALELMEDRVRTRSADGARVKVLGSSLLEESPLFGEYAKSLANS